MLLACDGMPVKGTGFTVSTRTCNSYAPPKKSDTGVCMGSRKRNGLLGGASLAVVLTIGGVAGVAEGQQSAVAGPVDTLSYFVNRTGHTLTGTHAISTWEQGNNVYYVKWDVDNFEQYTYDHQYIYLREDHSAPASPYTFSAGLWMKRSMSVGESVSASRNRIQRFGTGCTPAEQGIFPYTNTLLAHEPRFDVGGGIGVRDVIIMRYDYRYTDDGRHEKMYYAKDLGLVKWEEYIGDKLLHVSTFTDLAAAETRVPARDTACTDDEIPWHVAPLPTSIDEFVRMLYRCVLDKEPDAPGLAHWIDALRRGALTPQGAYEGFFPYQQGLTHAAYVDTVFRCVLFRDAEKSNRDSTVRALETGSMTRNGLLQGVLASTEFTRRILPTLRSVR